MSGVSFLPTLHLVVLPLAVAYDMLVGRAGIQPLGQAPGVFLSVFERSQYPRKPADFLQGWHPEASIERQLTED